IVTAIAFLYFKEKGADITVLEVGLGGSGDSTNVVKKPLACAITSISYDHMDRLGNTLAEIAADKAGIIKGGVPVVSNVPEREAAREIAKKAYEKDSKLYDISKNKFMIFDETPFSQKVSMEVLGTDYSDIEISMTGKHQGENLKTALTIIEILRKERKIKIERSKLYEGLKKATQPGRFEVLAEEPMVIIDGAHNEAGARALQETVSGYFEGQRILLVTGMLADKQVDEILKYFTAITDKMIITEPDNPRKLTVDELGETLKNMGIEPVKAKDAEESVKLAEKMKDDYDLILFAGSLYLIGNVRRIVRNEWGKGN
ncbi:MAG: bifunctional folylpolyglutamate synthase/dihydrofolate synthase, partial [Firmicutes bacterium]|nr:bifunctional folylpolyglutamate synthase/dihydrofolate synthase [Bacillota bacterium]